MKYVLITDDEYPQFIKDDNELREYETDGSIDQGYKLFLITDWWEYTIERNVVKTSAKKVRE